MKRLLCFLRDEDAATAVEYAVMLALILLAVIGAIGALGSENGDKWSNIRGELVDAGLGS
jgi:Flp pilus assembly pilin Flp